MKYESSYRPTNRDGDDDVVLWLANMKESLVAVSISVHKSHNTLNSRVSSCGLSTLLSTTTIIVKIIIALMYKDILKTF